MKMEWALDREPVRSMKTCGGLVISILKFLHQQPEAYNHNDLKIRKCTPVAAYCRHDRLHFTAVHLSSAKLKQ